VAGQALAPVPGLCSTTAAGLARRFTAGQWHALETEIGDIDADLSSAGTVDNCSIAPGSLGCSY
jgi:hypothetical protein